MITFDNTSKAYAGVPAINGLNLKISRGELLVLLGPSGSGKSTVLKMINRMVDHDSGRILLDGQEIYSFNVQDLRRRMGYAIQSVGLFPHWTVARNIATVPRLLGWSAERIDQRVDELLTLFTMEPTQYRQRMPHQLSGGQQQRVGVARALAADPDVLLMDEPFGALDPVTRASLQLELKRIHRVSGKTIVLVTHDIDEALLLATRIVLLQQGSIVQAGTPLELLQHPANDFCGGLFGPCRYGSETAVVTHGGRLCSPHRDRRQRIGGYHTQPAATGHDGTRSHLAQGGPWRHQLAGIWRPRPVARQRTRD